MNFNNFNPIDGELVEVRGFFLKKRYYPDDKGRIITEEDGKYFDFLDEAQEAARLDMQKNIRIQRIDIVSVGKVMETLLRDEQP